MVNAALSPLPFFCPLFVVPFVFVLAALSLFVNVSILQKKEKNTFHAPSDYCACLLSLTLLPSSL